ncbi:hypothetical protein MTR67_021852 [Solanum verrucosum]|uniref:Reverse transcriptase Ty1/copia-type domain-containing protein n=1 Tax=Solanum verrucosum TaxID=315347 RepID=A0AAF0QQS3_SOLVR|nr:hypothetical protein MTR67_021852 [Solanum verrucosum]
MKQPIGCKWVYKVKLQANSDIERFKARLVAKRYNQKEGLDYNETCSLVVKIATVRIVLFIAAQHDWHIHQLDVYNVFLQGDLHDEVYMQLPQGFPSQRESGIVCRLVKSLYGLKQESRQWNVKLTEALLHSQFQQSKLDHSLFIKKNRTGGAKPAMTPLEMNEKLTMIELNKFTGKEDDDMLEDVGQYQSVIGRLLYLTLTRPDITFSVQTLSQFLQQLKKSHWDAAIRIIRYVKRQPWLEILMTTKDPMLW